MEKNLFQQAKDIVEDLLNMDDDHDHIQHDDQDQTAAREAIQSASQQATSEEQRALEQLEQQIDDKFSR